MSLYAFTAPYPLKAAAELREAGKEAFALMMLDRRDSHRHKVASASAKARKYVPGPIVALRGYVFADFDTPDDWALQNLKHVRSPVKFIASGRWQPVPRKAADWLRDPPPPLFHDTESHLYERSAPLPLVNPGDIVRYRLASEEHTGPVFAVEDGHILLMEIRMLGRDVRIKVPSRMVEVVKDEGDEAAA